MKHLRELYPELPVLAVSGYVDAEEVQQYDFNGFIEKPVVMAELARFVEEVLAG